MSATAIHAVLTADREALAAGGLERLHDRLRREDISCGVLAAGFAEALGRREDPGGHALAAVAAEADRSGVDNSFHNPAHSREVAVNWWLLAQLHPAPLSDEAVLLGLIAAFGHDLGHDGRDNGAIPFRLEAVAAQTTADRMRGAAMADQAVAAATAMILCTDVRHGYPRLISPGDDPRFAPLADAQVALSAKMLRDADLLPSAGVSIAAYRARSAELEREGRLAPGALSAEAFFDRVVERRFLSPAAQNFAATMAAIAAEATGS